MAAPKSNIFWKKRKEHGKPKKYTGAQLWDEACKYFQWCDDNPLVKQDFVGKDAKEVHRITPRPYTIVGLCVALGICENTFLNYRKNPKDNLQVLRAYSNDLYDVSSLIYNIIYQDQFTGAAVGIYNPLIIARSLGLKNKKEVTHDINPNGVGPVTLEFGDKKLEFKNI